MIQCLTASPKIGPRLTQKTRNIGLNKKRPARNPQDFTHGSVNQVITIQSELEENIVIMVDYMHTYIYI